MRVIKIAGRQEIPAAPPWKLRMPVDVSLLSQLPRQPIRLPRTAHDLHSMQIAGCINKFPPWPFTVAGVLTMRRQSSNKV
jgi:hypothetical protein